MPTVNEITVDGYLQSSPRVFGDVSMFVETLGALSNNNQISGESFLPNTLDRTAIHYDTTAAWNSMVGYIAERGHVYVYSDYTIKENDDGTTTLIPAIKIGDGTSYLIDLPVVTSSDDEEWIDHINNWLIHVSDNDRTTWNNKVSAQVNEPDENLVFSF